MVTYTQNWPAYNAAQTKEKLEFMRLLSDACDLIQTKPIKRVGRPRLSLRDMVYACTLKVYCGQSSRRFMSDLALAREKGYLTSKPHFNSVSNYFRSTSVATALKHLIRITSLPLASIEQDFAVDSSGFSASTYGRWLDIRTTRIKRQEWSKLHIIVGVKTQIITAIHVTPGNTGDSPQLPALVQETNENFEMREVSADKAYSSRNNLQVIADIGAKPLIPFKSNARARASRCPMWHKMFYYFKMHQEEFYEHYHKRSNVETVFHMIKSKFGVKLLSRSMEGRTSEVLAKALCHNVCVVNQEVHELGIQANFNTHELAAQKLNAHH